jgi:hypothetical protein
VVVELLGLAIVLIELPIAVLNYMTAKLAARAE